jgi:hypothetical protein
VYVCCSCTVSNEAEKYQGSRNNIIHVRDRVKEITMEEPPISSLNRLHLMDRYLIIQDMKSLNKLIYLFDKDNFAYVTGAVHRGQGPNEIANMGLLAVDEAHRRFYVSDHGKNKIFSYNLDSILSDSSCEPEVKMEMGTDIFPDYYQILNDSIFICRVIQRLENNNYKPAVGKMNTKTGAIALMNYENPKITGRKRSSVAVSVEHGIYVEYHHNIDLMTICTLEGRLICNIYGPDWSNDSKRNAYYSKVVFCGDKIYATYLGERSFNQQRQSNLPLQLIVFDLNGNYIHTLDTGLRISDFCYDKESRRLLLSFNDDIQFGYLDLD